MTEDWRATAGEQLRIATDSDFDRRTADGRRLLDQCMRIFAGAPRILGIPDLRLGFSTRQCDRRSISISYGANRGYATATMPRKATDGDVLVLLREMARRLRRQLLNDPVAARASDPQPWTIETSPLLLSMLEDAGVDPIAYHAELLRIRGKYPPRGPLELRSGDAESRPALRRLDRPRHEFPWALPYHAVSLGGDALALDCLELRADAFWSSSLHKGVPGLLLGKTTLPTTMRQALVGQPLSAAVGHAATRHAVDPVQRVMTSKGDTLLLARTTPVCLAPPPAEIAESLAAMTRGFEILRRRLFADGPLHPTTRA